MPKPTSLRKGAITFYAILGARGHLLVIVRQAIERGCRRFVGIAVGDGPQLRRAVAPMFRVVEIAVWHHTSPAQTRDVSAHQGGLRIETGRCAEMKEIAATAAAFRSQEPIIEVVLQEADVAVDVIRGEQAVVAGAQRIDLLEQV